MDGQPHESQRPSQATSDSVVGHGESIAKHPLSGEPDFAELRRKVQFCEISWPVGVVIISRWL